MDHSPSVSIFSGNSIEENLAELKLNNVAALLNNCLHGVEKESLRIAPDGLLASTLHPEALGASLTHPQITTDFAESLIELVTEPQSNLSLLIKEITDIHKFVQLHLKGETLWPTSMPCILKSEKPIMIAQYGSSHKGLVKMLYRQGLIKRYGLNMQLIAGVHYNFSLSPELVASVQRLNSNHLAPSKQDWASHTYFHMIRNYWRQHWLLIYLFGASPSLCKSFLGEKAQLEDYKDLELEEFDDCTFYGRYATSLRMSEIGYQNKSQSQLKISFNNLKEYVDQLTKAIQTPDPVFSKFAKYENKQLVQMNGNILQIENEYYSLIRPKPLNNSVRTLKALKNNGVGYLEVRALDLNPFDPIGMNESQLSFLQLFMLGCFLKPSPILSENAMQEWKKNEQLSAVKGRQPGLKLSRDGGSVTLQDWGLEILNQLEPLAQYLDQLNNNSTFQTSLNTQKQKLFDSDLTPAGQILKKMREKKCTFIALIDELNHKHQKYFAEYQLDHGQMNKLVELALTSKKNARELEQANKGTFEEYLENYLGDID